MNRVLTYPIKYYTITYLYRETGEFIRGWHGVKNKSFYLPTVMLENVYNNGTWIKNTDKLWPRDNVYNMEETGQRLNNKYNRLSRKTGIRNQKEEEQNTDPTVLYSSSVKHLSFPR